MTHALTPYADTIMQSLEAIAARDLDPTQKIYARLFSRHPSLEPLFVMDKDGSVRGEMVQTCLEYILDFIGPRTTSPFLIPAARMDHDGYGVPEGMFDEFLIALRDEFRDQLGPRWTTEMEDAWAALLKEFANTH